MSGGERARRVYINLNDVQAIETHEGKVISDPFNSVHSCASIGEYLLILIIGNKCIRPALGLQHAAVFNRVQN